jgi:hypothetical protein
MYPPQNDFPEIDQLRLVPDDGSDGIPVELPSRRRRRLRQFLPALPVTLFARLVPLPGKALAVYLVALQRSRMRKRNPVALTTAYLSQFRISRGAKIRALTALEKAGLVRVEKRGRRNPLVHLLEEADCGHAQH